MTTHELKIDVSMNQLQDVAYILDRAREGEFVSAELDSRDSTIRVVWDVPSSYAVQPDVLALLADCRGFIIPGTVDQSGLPCDRRPVVRRVRDALGYWF